MCSLPRLSQLTSLAEGFEWPPVKHRWTSGNNSEFEVRSPMTELPTDTDIET